MAGLRRGVLASEPEVRCVSASESQLPESPGPIEQISRCRGAVGSCCDQGTPQSRPLTNPIDAALRCTVLGDCRVLATSLGLLGTGRGMCSVWPIGRVPGVYTSHRSQPLWKEATSPSLSVLLPSSWTSITDPRTDTPTLMPSVPRDCSGVASACRSRLWCVPTVAPSEGSREMDVGSFWLRPGLRISTERMDPREPAVRGDRPSASLGVLPGVAGAGSRRPPPSGELRISVILPRLRVSEGTMSGFTPCVLGRDVSGACCSPSSPSSTNSALNAPLGVDVGVFTPVLRPLSMVLTLARFPSCDPTGPRGESPSPRLRMLSLGE
mmetsp:Transcript_27651/g.63684  ORF Transcript_27651/g.63684 Transcript_27651/m.63684 type:complete len:324 (+) Transcript_27651:179-1150(+)